jgi:hypothetical protein
MRIAALTPNVALRQAIFHGQAGRASPYRHRHGRLLCRDRGNLSAVYAGTHRHARSHGRRAVAIMMFTGYSSVTKRHAHIIKTVALCRRELASLMVCVGAPLIVTISYG